MGRKKKRIVRERAPDPRYRSDVATRFIHCLMKQGKKSTAERLFYQAMEAVGKKSGKDPLEVFKQALDNVKPYLEVRSRRVGGATYQVPVEVSGDRRAALAMRWIISFARERKGIPFGQKLAAELLDAFNNEGAAIKKKQNMHKMAEANKAFAHYRW